MAATKKKHNDAVPAMRAELNNVKRQLAGKSPVNLLAGQVVAGSIAANAVVAGNIAASSISADELQVGSVTASAIAADSITSAAIAAGTITADDIAAGTITATTIAAGTITGDKIAAGTLTATNIAAGTITATQIAASTITATQIQAGSINSDRLYAGSIQAQRIQTNNLAAQVITANEIAANTITTGNLASNSVTTIVLAADSVTSAKIAANTITASDIAAGTITATQIAASTITATQIASATITGGLIAAGTVTATNIAAGTITGSLIAASTITGSLIASATIDSTKISVSQLSALSADLGAISAGTITGATFRTSAGTARVQMDSTGIFAKDTANADTFRIDAATGNVTLKGTLTTGSTLPAGIVTAAAVGFTIGGGNVIWNSNFGNGALTYTRDGIVYGQANNGGTYTFTALPIDNRPVATAIYSADTATVNALHSLNPQENTNYFGAAANQIWTFSYWVQGITDSTGSAVSRILFLDASNGVLSTTDSSSVTATVGTWTRVTVTATAPTSTAKVRGSVRVNSTATTHVRITALQLEQGAVPTAYAPRGDEIRPGQVTGGTDGLLAASTITSTNLGSGSVTTAAILNATIAGADIAAATVSGTNIVAATITGGLVAAATIAGSNLVANTITAGQIASATITATQIASATITATQIAASTITGSNIAANTIGAGNIAANTITASQLAAGAVTATVLAAGSVTADRLSIGQPVVVNVRNGNFAEANPADGATALAGWVQAGTTSLTVQTDATFGRVTQSSAPAGNSYLAQAVSLPIGRHIFRLWCKTASFTTTAILNAQLASIGGLAAGTATATVTASPTQTGTVGWTLLEAVVNVTVAGTVNVFFGSTGSGTGIAQFANLVAAASISNTTLAPDSVTTDKILANTIVAGDIASATITGTQIAANTITAGQIASGTITATQIQAGSITADRLSVTSLSAITADLGTVTAGTLTGALVQTASTGARVEIAGSTNTIKIYDSSAQRVQMDGTNGLQLLAGTTTDPGTAQSLRWSTSIGGATDVGRIFSYGNLSTDTAAAFFGVGASSSRGANVKIEAYRGAAANAGARLWVQAHAADMSGAVVATVRNVSDTVDQTTILIDNNGDMTVYRNLLAHDITGTNLTVSNQMSAAAGIVLLPSANSVTLKGTLGVSKSGASNGSIKVTIDGTDYWIPYFT